MIALSAWGGSPGRHTNSAAGVAGPVCHARKQTETRPATQAGRVPWNNNNPKDTTR